MKDIYTYKIEVYVNLKNGDNIFVPQRWRSAYQYGNMPKNQEVKISGEDNCFNYLKTFMLCPNDVTFFRHREYIFVRIDSPIRNFKKVYKSQIDSVLVSYYYTKIEEPRMEYLKNDLGFYTYSQLIFDREQDLKEMLIE